MINELEEQVIRLVKNTIVVAINCHEGNYTLQEAVKEILQRSEVKLHEEAINELVEWLKQSKL